MALDRITQLRIERKLSEGLAALPLPTRTIINAWYANEIHDIEAGRKDNEVKDEDLEITMEAINDAVKNIN